MIKKLDEIHQFFDSMFIRKWAMHNTVILAIVKPAAMYVYEIVLVLFYGHMGSILTNIRLLQIRQ
jgi:hypothetical protein